VLWVLQLRVVVMSWFGVSDYLHVCWHQIWNVVCFFVPSSMLASMHCGGLREPGLQLLQLLTCAS
jgi:hypothetical protein